MRTRLFLAVILWGLAGCDSPTRTVETTRKHLAAYQAQPTAQNQAEVEKSLANLDARIAELEEKGDHVQAELFRRQASNLRTDFQAAKVAQAINSASKAIQGIGEAFRDVGKTFGEAFKNTETNAP
ncbi:MAG: hypothetical protein IAE94_15765 [Chthoniobacterales bacterium]|nr:hypothetical protein [Chthoniobacterales bacterium]